MSAMIKLFLGPLKKWAYSDFMHETWHARYLIINLISDNVKCYTFLFTITFQDTFVVLVSCHFFSLCLVIAASTLT